ncbi:g8656 [Coccomyxa viridis]|uniref:G8656 protein n=1 Tax=Coccomyxa viridis TaxID=1274662 RepID=A0ABP1G0X0_9CHLO
MDLYDFATVPAFFITYTIVQIISSAWFVGVMWILRWESNFELRLLLQILPILLIPLQTIFNNVAEEILSWIGGSGQPGLLSGDVQARAGLPNLVADPLGFWHFLLFTLPWRIGSSLKRMVLWVCGMPIENHNHSFVNYAQGLDFSVGPKDISDFFGKEVQHADQLKSSAWVLTKAALLAYERLHVARGVLERDWTKHAEKAAYTSKVVAAWHFDVITSVDRDELARTEHAPTWAETTAMLLSLEYQDRTTQDAPIKKALILTFRGTEALKNANWFTDFATAPPKADDHYSTGQVHQGFEMALGLETRTTTLQPARGVQTSYVLYEDTRTPAGYEARRVAGASTGIDSWPPQTVEGSPYSVITEKILEVMKDEAYELHVTGHSLGAALAHLYTAALLVPKQSPWNRVKMNLSRFKALCTQGQPRLGTFEYNRRLEQKLCQGADPSQYRYMRLVNGDDIVCRVPPLQVTLPPLSVVRGMWQHSGHLVYLPVKHTTLTPQPQRAALRMYEQPCSYRLSVLWNSVRRALHCTDRYMCHGGAGNATLLRLLSDWVIVVTVLPLGLGLLLFPPLFPLAVILIIIGVWEAGMLQGVSDHALDGYLNAIQNSQPSEWE